MKINKEVKSLVFKIINRGPIIKNRYSNDLHAFGDEVKSAGIEDALANIAYIGPYEDENHLEVVIWSDHISVPEVIKFLKKYKLKI